MHTHPYQLLPTSSPPLGCPPPSASRMRNLARRRYIFLALAGIFSVGFVTTLLAPAEGVEQLNAWTDDTIVSWNDDKSSWKAAVAGWFPQDTEITEDTHGETRECKGWDPLLPEERDPIDCLKAKQYRQTKRVLDREEKLIHDHWYFTVKHNRETLRSLTKCFLPVADVDYTPCREKPLVISGWWYTAEVLNGATTGEVVWQRSVVDQLATLGYHFIAVGPYNNWVRVAEMMPDVYAILWNSDIETVSCVTDPRCIAKEHYVPPMGGEDLSIGVPDDERGVIPLWALNVVDYWGARPKEISHNDYWWGLKEDGDWTYQPLGQEWIATPWPLHKHVHLSYSMEETCLSLPVTPIDERLDSALILAKRSAYFHYKHVSPPSFWTNLTRDEGIDLLSTSDIEEGSPLPEGIETMGRQTVEEYAKLVGSVKAMVGIGVPVISPSVYAALCQGTPVVIPVFYEPPRNEKWAPYSGYSQHGPALTIGEPYVYSYRAQDYDSLLSAVTKAMSTPIERYIPEDMTLAYALPRLEEYINRDLEGMMAKKVAENGGKIPQLLKGARERCLELNRCQQPFEAGRKPAVPGSDFEL